VDFASEQLFVIGSTALRQYILYLTMLYPSVMDLRAKTMKG